TARALFTRPSGAMGPSILTFPVTFMRLARSGYTGATFVLTLRFPSSVEADWAKPDVASTPTNAVAAKPFRNHLDRIDTTPPRNGECPRAENARQMPASTARNGTSCLRNKLQQVQWTSEVRAVRRSRVLRVFSLPT